MGQATGNEIFVEQDDHMQHKDNNDDLCEDHQDMVSLARMGHAQEDAEDVKGQEGYDDLGNDARHNVLKLLKHLVQGLAAHVGNAQAYHKREHERTHDVEHGGYLYLKERFQLHGLVYRHRGGVGNESGKERRPCAVGKQASKDGVAKGKGHRDDEQFARPIANVGNGWRHQSDDDQRYHKTQKLAKDAVEGEKRSDESLIKDVAEDHAQHNGHNDLCQ